MWSQRGRDCTLKKNNPPLFHMSASDLTVGQSALRKAPSIFGQPRFWRRGSKHFSSRNSRLNDQLKKPKYVLERAIDIRQQQQNPLHECPVTAMAALNSSVEPKKEEYAGGMLSMRTQYGQYGGTDNSGLQTKFLHSFSILAMPQFALVSQARTPPNLLFQHSMPPKARKQYLGIIS